MKSLQSSSDKHLGQHRKTWWREETLQGKEAFSEEVGFLEGLIIYYCPDFQTGQAPRSPIATHRNGSCSVLLKTRPALCNARSEIGSGRPRGQRGRRGRWEHLEERKERNVMSKKAGTKMR